MFVEVPLPPTLLFDWFYLGFRDGLIVLATVTAVLLALWFALTRYGVKKGWGLVVCVGLFVIGDLIVYGIGATNLPYDSRQHTRTRNDLLQFSVALDKFKSVYKRYPRNTLKLCSHASSYDTEVEFDRQSHEFIGRVWRDLGNDFAGINWANRPAFDAKVPTIDILDGDQCLVFFLCGPPADGSNPVAGLSEGVPANPRDPNAPNTRRIKFLDIPAHRLMQRPAGNLTVSGREYKTTTAFPSHADGYGFGDLQSPYLYFSSSNFAAQPNGYDRHANSLGVTPYFVNSDPLTFHRPNTFQLISAGRDQKFGPGGHWLPQAANNYADVGRDDMTNLYERLMGTPE